jgi:DNA-3-methyladenine glycosylase II
VKTTPTPTELTNGPTQTSSPPSKIHFRPRKIRKLSPDKTPDPNNSTKIVPITTTETQTQPQTPTLKPKSTKSKIVQHRVTVQAVPRMVARSLSYEGEVEIALRHLRSADPNLSPLIDLHPLPMFDTFQTHSLP